MSENDKERVQSTVTRARSPVSKTQVAIVGVFSLVAIVALIIVGLWLVKPRSNAGRPVPAPSSTAIDQSAATILTNGEQALTLKAEEAQRVGI
ncbi:MAG TPA: hypothetical protein VKB46_02605, partial [Pyrinomonadaceae bacterium]|nr:hypothetical protein [Pyrinomonadaceae bacterium]